MFGAVRPAIHLRFGGHVHVDGVGLADHDHPGHETGRESRVVIKGEKVGAAFDASHLRPGHRGQPGLKTALHERHLADVLLDRIRKVSVLAIDRVG